MAGNSSGIGALQCAVFGYSFYRYQCVLIKASGYQGILQMCFPSPENTSFKTGCTCSVWIMDYTGLGNWVQMKNEAIQDKRLLSE